MNKFDSGTDWTFDQIDDCYLELQKIADEEFQLSYYPNQIEIISSEQMLDAYAAVGMPVMYEHWSFGKKLAYEQEAYKRGHMGLAYEIVINSNPCIAYLMEENTMCMQSLVLAHASFGHNSFFKNNQTFTAWTDAEAIVDYLVFARNYVAECERRYGVAEVSRTLDAAHALQLHGVDRYKRAPQMSKAAEKQRQQAREAHDQQNFNELWHRTVPKAESNPDQIARFPAEPEENILYFLEKYAPNLEDWKRELLRIVRKVAQYFYPQMLTQKMNEGWATFMHYHMTMEMRNRGLVTDGFMLEFLKNHTNVITQRPYTHNINPYAIGFAMYEDIKRVATNPTKEDEKWFRADWVGSGDWLSATKFAMRNFKDESFIMQYLSPKVMRDFKFMCVLDDDDNEDMIVSAIQDDEGYRTIRERLSENCNVNNRIPNIQIEEADVYGDRLLSLVHYSSDRHLLRENATTAVMQHLAYLWGYSIEITTVDKDDRVLDSYVVEYQ